MLNLIWEREKVMRIHSYPKLFFISVLVLGVSIAYANIVPSIIDGATYVGNCEQCNWSNWSTCSTSQGAQGTCTSKYCETGGTGSGEVEGPYSYCSGVLYCDEEEGHTCSVGNNCIAQW